jgi:ABC-type sugar transport system ATPase subunit
MISRVSAAGCSPGTDVATIAVDGCGISKSYGTIPALVDVDFDLRYGEILALAGENGSGKSTLAKIVAGTLLPDRGNLTVGGLHRVFRSPRDALDTGIALVAQEPAAAPDLTIGENIMLSATSPFSRVRRRAIFDAASEYLARVGLHVDPRRRFGSLRGGERELAAVARALATTPRVLILDEVTARLPDPGHLLQVLDGLRADGIAIVLITHRLREMELVADRAIVLRDGRRVAILPREEIRADRLTGLMVGRELKSFFHVARAPRGDLALRVTDVVLQRESTPISLEVHHGEVVGLAGLIGSGRTELLEAIAGVHEPRGGVISVEGSSVPPGSVRAAIDAGILLTPEDRVLSGLFLRATVRENIVTGTHRALSLARHDAERRSAQQLVSRLRIRSPGLEAPARHLSGGNQQKLILARTLLRGPKVLLLDEPTRGLDIGAKEEVYEIVGELVQDGLAVLIASSDLIEVIGLCDRIIVLCEGAVAGELTRANSTEEQIVRLSSGYRAA